MSPNDEIFLSVVVPCFNEQAVLSETHDRIEKVLQALGVGYEVIYVNDGSSDGTQGIVDALCENSPNIKAIHLAVNAGHQAALWTGLRYSSGEFVVVLDADLQDPPDVIPQMLEVLRNPAFDVAYGRRTQRQGERVIKRATAYGYYRLLRWLSESPIPTDAGDFRMMRRTVVAAMAAMDYHPGYVRGVTSWLGFRHVAVDYVREPRFAGRSSYTWNKMLSLALTGLVEFGSLARIVIVGACLSGAGLAVYCWWAMQPFSSLKEVQVVGFVFFSMMFMLWSLLMLVYVRRIFDILRGYPKNIIGGLRNLK